MTTQPEALRLANSTHLAYRVGWQREAAAELRRLHAENEELWKEREEPHKTIEMYVRECNRLESERDALKTQRDALLEALKEVVAFTGAHGGPYAKARAAIAAAEEEGK